jgi:hypothetical protein
MSFRKTVKIKFNVDLEILGGDGTSLENPIVINQTQQYNYVSLEKKCIDYACHILQMDWVMEKQELIEHEGKSIDVIRIGTSTGGDFKYNIKQTSFYFDVTDCIKNSLTAAEVYKLW